jgi:hypothetical protein
LIWESPYDVLAIGVADQADAIESLARRGLVRAPSRQHPADRVRRSRQLDHRAARKALLGLVLLAGTRRQRRLRLEVTYTNKEGEEHHGDFETDFSARGFGPGCNPQTTPRFTLAPKGDVAPAPAPAAEPDLKSETGLTKKGKKPAPDARQHDQGEDAPVAPPDQSGYAK